MGDEENKGQNGNGSGISWRIIATAGWIALWAIVLYWMQNIDAKVDKLSGDVAGLKGWIAAHHYPMDDQ